MAEVASSRAAATSHTVHDSWTFQAFFRVLFGDKSSILAYREFVAFRQGLVVSVPGIASDAPVSLLQVSTVQCWGTVTNHLLFQSMTEVIDIEDLPQFILAMYDRKISDCSPFIRDHIEFHIIGGEDGKTLSREEASLPPAETRKRRSAQKLFRIRFKRYLQGHGHPAHPRLSLVQIGRLSAEDFEAEVWQSSLTYPLANSPFSGCFKYCACHSSVTSSHRFPDGTCGSIMGSPCMLHTIPV